MFFLDQIMLLKLLDTYDENSSIIINKMENWSIIRWKTIQ